MKRLILPELCTWRTSPIRKPMILRGARQVGKTHLVRQFGEAFPHFVEINFEKQSEAIKIFDHDLDPVRIIRELSLIAESEIIPGKTLLFLDEIQEAPKAIIALRYFYEEMPDLHVIAAGSLLDFAIHKVGVPVGRVTFCYLYPMSFIEFLVACGQNLLAKEIIKHNPMEPFSEVIHEKCLRLLGEYMAIGGMPKVVQQWANNQDVRLCQELQHNIKAAYEADFIKYAKKHQIKYVDLLYQQIPMHICKQFKYSHLATSYRKRELEPALNLLNKAGIFHFIYHSLGQGVPLGAQADFDKFKLIMLDVALNQSILGLNIKDWFLQPEIALVNKGQIAEAFVGQELLAYSDPHNLTALYYWQHETRSSSAEVDYLISDNSNIIPIEVKSGRGSHLRSIRSFLEAHPQSSSAIRFSVHNYSVFDGIHSYPLYAVAGAITNKQLLLELVE